MEEPITEVIETIPAAEPAPVEQPELVHVYQPTDESGRPMGGKQVLKYRTHEELVQKMQEQNVLLIRKLREETKNRRLGIGYEDEISEEAPRLRTPVDFAPRQLSDDERITLSRDLLDPDRFSQAADMLFEATLGAKPQALREVLADVQNRNIRLQAKIEADAFVAANPDYVVCPENFQTIVAWMERKNLEPVRANFQKAYDTLRSVMIERAPVEAPPVQTPVQVADPVIEQPASVPGISSGLTKDQAANTGTPVPVGSDIVYEFVTGGRTQIIDGKPTVTGGTTRRLTGKAALDAMPSEEYKRRLRDPKFAQKVEKLLGGK